MKQSLADAFTIRCVIDQPKTAVRTRKFLARLRNDPRSVEEKEGKDDGKEGRATVISAISLDR